MYGWLLDLIRLSSSYVVILVETCKHNNRCCRIIQSSNMDSTMASEVCGFAGDIWVFRDSKSIDFDLVASFDQIMVLSAMKEGKRNQIRKGSPNELEKVSRPLGSFADWGPHGYGFTGSVYTWSNCKSGTKVQERIGRAWCESGWQLLMSGASFSRFLEKSGKFTKMILKAPSQPSWAKDGCGERFRPVPLDERDA
ncbi:hypothetical protein M9H77_30688 [Catharanthus roseus]|uniref:Uncharacterized protein n=1 Tax=Catharanthus roseus TaxID=4058 RepID=A0ACB9ZYC5_CATRO|nr:hypothetical protein M9H77_30688 [Catharanthus roseus]